MKNDGEQQNSGDNRDCGGQGSESLNLPVGSENMSGCCDGKPKEKCCNKDKEATQSVIDDFRKWAEELTTTASDKSDKVPPDYSNMSNEQLTDIVMEQLDLLKEEIQEAMQKDAEVLKAKQVFIDRVEDALNELYAATAEGESSFVNKLVATTVFDFVMLMNNVFVNALKIGIQEGVVGKE